MSFGRAARYYPDMNEHDRNIFIFILNMWIGEYFLRGVGNEPSVSGDKSR